MRKWKVLIVKKASADKSRRAVTEAMQVLLTALRRQKKPGGKAR